MNDKMQINGKLSQKILCVNNMGYSVNVPLSKKSREKLT